jgi:hypothetical protein
MFRAPPECSANGQRGGEPVGLLHGDAAGEMDVTPDPPLDEFVVRLLEHRVGAIPAERARW